MPGAPGLPGPGAGGPGAGPSQHGAAPWCRAQPSAPPPGVHAPTGSMPQAATGKGLLRQLQQGASSGSGAGAAEEPPSAFSKLLAAVGLPPEEVKRKPSANEAGAAAGAFLLSLVKAGSNTPANEGIVEAEMHTDSCLYVQAGEEWLRASAQYYCRHCGMFVNNVKAHVGSHQHQRYKLMSLGGQAGQFAGALQTGGAAASTWQEQPRQFAGAWQTGGAVASTWQATDGALGAEHPARHHGGGAACGGRAGIGGSGAWRHGGGAACGGGGPGGNVAYSMGGCNASAVLEVPFRHDARSVEAAAAAAAASAAGLPLAPAKPAPPWQLAWSQEHGSYYYWNTTNSKVQWERPTGA